jgi:LexA-binding, inner membrane-associated putative hydrolase
MASFRGHLAFSASLGAVFGGLSYWQLGYDWGTAALAAGLTAVGGMLPDLDSDSGVPVREMFGLAAVFIPLVLLRRLIHTGLEAEQILVVIGLLFIGIRYGLSRLFKRFTVHRGMFHSVPAMLIAGMLTFLGYHHPQYGPRLLLAIAVMMGFLSHLLLDELYAVDFRGLKPKFNQFAGSALKFASKSRVATAITYVLLLVLGGLVFLDVNPRGDSSGQGSPTMNVPPLK